MTAEYSGKALSQGIFNLPPDLPINPSKNSAFKQAYFSPNDTSLCDNISLVLCYSPPDDPFTSVPHESDTMSGKEFGPLPPPRRRLPKRIGVRFIRNQIVELVKLRIGRELDGQTGRR